LHCLNLPIAALVFLAEGQSFEFCDLWFGLLFAYIYILFYLFVLDANGYIFYVIFSPRTAYSVVLYPLVLVLYYALWVFWNFAQRFLNDPATAAAAAASV